MKKVMFIRNSAFVCTLGAASFEMFQPKWDIKWSTVKELGFNILSIVIVLLLCGIFIKIGKKMIARFFDKQKESSRVPITDKRADTLKTITISVFRYSIYFVALTAILSTFNINVTSILTVAGIGGIAIGFGAQNLVKDVITGFFVLLEDQYAVGDTVTINNLTGTVKEIGIRTTKLKNFNGDIYIIPNGQISIVTNHTRSNKLAIIDVVVAYSESPEAVIKKLEEVCSEAANIHQAILVEPPAVLGITEFKGTYYTVRITATTLPDQQAAVERSVRLMVRNTFEKEGIKSFDRHIIKIEE